jgi:hypothetical protein
MATVDPNSVLGQIQTLNNTLSAYFQAMAAFANDTTGSTQLPDFSTVADGLDHSELLRMTNSRTSDSASFQNGAAIENLSHSVAIIREYNMRTKSKVEFYQDAGTDFASDSGYYATKSSYYSSMLNGFYKESDA